MPPLLSVKKHFSLPTSASRHPIPETRLPPKEMSRHCLGKSKRGLSKRGLSPKGANWARKGPFGGISLASPWLWGAEESVLISPEKAPIGPGQALIGPEKARFSRKDFCLIFSENSGLKRPFVSPRLDFPKLSDYFDKTSYPRPRRHFLRKESKALSSWWWARSAFLFNEFA